ncbi:MAG: hypothetical protein ABSD30_16020 [Candidatus Binatus sp.]
MKSLTTITEVVLLAAVVSLTGCSAGSSANDPAEQTRLAIQMGQLQKLKTAEYEDYMAAMTSEDANQKLANYYAAKGTQVHGVISAMEDGQPVNDMEISRALDDSDSARYDNTPPLNRD